MTLELDIGANLDNTELQAELNKALQQLNKFRQDAAKSMGVPFTPISRDAVKSAEDINKQFKIMINLSTDFKRRMRDTGQQNRGFFDVDWDKLYPNQAVRNRKKAEAYQYVTGHALNNGGVAPPSPPPAPSSAASGGAGGGQNNKPSGGGIVTNAARAGLNATSGATGGVGGVAANALGTGASNGFGAGVKGLFGGLLALGVGKVIGSVADKMGQAEDNAVAFDKLKRVIGDVGVSFTGLKANIMSTSDAVRLKFSDTAILATQYARAGNLSNPNEIPSELKTSVGFSRSFGLEPSEGVGTFGGLRGVNITKNDIATKRFALLIGETIGKSKAFAKAGEVMAAMANYATIQARNSLSAGGSVGYGGALAGLVGSRIPGLDVQGASSLLARANQAIMGGGAAGEGSQFLSNLIGQRLGLNPFQAQMMREGGAFATKSSTFDSKSVYRRYMGKSGPQGDETMLGATLSNLRRTYGDKTDQDKGFLAQATANHLGLNMAQAMALLSVNPMKIGGMQKYADLKDLTGSGIANLSMALHGDDGQRKDLAAGLLARSGSDRLSDTDREELKSVMAGGDAAKQKDFLAQLVATRDQESTQGTDIRDSKNILDNLKVSIADKLIPYTQDIRFGIMKLAGVGIDGQSFSTIIEDMMRGESEGNIKRIEDSSFSESKLLIERRAALMNQASNPARMKGDNNDVYTAGGELDSINEKLAKISEKKRGLITEENNRLAANLAEHRANDAALRKISEDEKKAKTEAVNAEKESNAYEARKNSALSGGYAGFGSSGFMADLSSKKSRIFSAMINKESGGRQFDKNGNPLTSPKGAVGIGQIMPSTGPEAAKLAGVEWDEELFRYDKDYQLLLSEAYFNKQLNDFGGDFRMALSGYNAGGGATRKGIAKAKKHGGDFLKYMPNETQDYVPSILNAAEANTPTPFLPSGGDGKNNQAHVTIDPLIIVLKNTKGETLHTQKVSPQVKNNWSR